MTPIGRRYSSQSCSSGGSSITSSNPSIVVYRPKAYANGIPPPSTKQLPTISSFSKVTRTTKKSEEEKRRSSADTVNSFISLLSIPPEVLKEKRASLHSLQEHREEFLRKTAMLRKLSLADRPKPSTAKVSKQIRKFSLQVANGIQELFDENGKYQFGYSIHISFIFK